MRVALLLACSSLPLLSVEEEEGRRGGRPLPERRGAEEEGRREERGAEEEASSPEADRRGASWGTCGGWNTSQTSINIKKGC